MHCKQKSINHADFATVCVVHDWATCFSCKITIFERFMPLPHGPLVPICIRIVFFQIILLTSLVTNKGMDGRTNGQVENITPLAGIKWQVHKNTHSKCTLLNTKLYDIDICSIFQAAHDSNNSDL